LYGFLILRYRGVQHNLEFDSRLIHQFDWGPIMNFYKTLTLTCACFAAFSQTAQAATVISNGAADGAIFPFGFPNTVTYGQVFTAPIDGKLKSFSLSLNGGVGALFGAVGTWNGTPTFDFGYGSPVTLFTSAITPSSAAQTFTFSPNVAVNAGDRYVAYLSTFGVTGANAATTMPTTTNAVPGIDYFVFNNSLNPAGNPSWNYFVDIADFGRGNAQFSATFEEIPPIPEPETWVMMIAGFGLAGSALRRQRANVRAKVTFA
jgi:PEP-CTERM motif